MGFTKVIFGRESVAESRVFAGDLLYKWSRGLGYSKRKVPREERMRSVIMVYWQVDGNMKFWNFTDTQEGSWRI